LELLEGPEVLLDAPTGLPSATHCDSA
jgi:hypothetical protein